MRSAMFFSRHVSLLARIRRSAGAAEGADTRSICRRRPMRFEPLELRIALSGSPANADLVYDPDTGNVQLDASEADGQVIVNFVLLMSA